jgi:UDP-N-acetylglucosamine 2-epimerase
MYEAHFGISGPPFQLSPDPTFYYDSKGHHDALAVLRRGLVEQRGVVVVSGEIGAGKTTLVRTLLGEIDPATLVVGQVLSTQLDDLELLRAILLAFGAPAEQDDADVLRRALQAHLMTLAREGRRAILIVDEAQNLHRSAFEMLAQLETGAVPGGLPIKVVLVGQPELRELVASGELRALRERVQAACHLAPLAPDETGAYVRHRLAKVGWSGTPSFEPGSLEEIHRWTSGVPRRINLLCNRLMLSRFLAAQTRIDAATVAQTATDLRAEIGDFSVPPPAVEPAPPPAVETAPAPAPAEVLPAQMLEPLADPDIALDLPAPSVIAELPPAPPPPAAEPRVPAKAPREPKKRAPPVLTSVVLAPESRPLVLVVGGQADHIKAAALMRAMAARRDLPVALLVRAYANNAFERNREMYAGLDVAGRVINLGIAGGTYAGRAAELMQRFEFVVDHCQPGAVVVFDGSDAALSCGLVASRKSVPVVQVGAGLRARVQGAADITRRLTDQLCDVLYTPEAAANERLLHEGVPPERLCFAGNLLVDALQMALRSSLGVASPRERLGIAPEFLSDRNGYGVVVLDAAANVGERQTFTELVTILRDVSRDVPLVWPMHTRTREQLAKFRLDALLRGERIACVPTQSYVSFTQVLANATCVLTDSWHVQEETTALSIPCLTLGLEPERSITCEIGSNVAVGRNKALATRTVWECIFNGGKRGRLPEHWDGQAGARIAEHLALWLKLALEQRAPAGVTSGA